MIAILYYGKCNDGECDYIKCNDGECHYIKSNDGECDYIKCNDGECDYIKPLWKMKLSRSDKDFRIFLQIIKLIF